MPTLFMMIGLPGCGKSTFIQNMNAFGELNSGQLSTILSTDDYIETIANKTGKTYNQVFSKEIMGEAEQALTNRLNDAIKYQDNIIWDQTNLTRKTRAAKLARIPFNYKKIAIYVYAGNHREHEKRLASRPGKVIPERVINSMISSFEYPHKDEGFDFVYEVMT